MNRDREAYADANADLERLREEEDRLLGEKAKQIAALETDFQPDSIPLERVEISPRKSDIDVKKVILVWIPWQVDPRGQRKPLY